jgi:hypothetical protein
MERSAISTPGIVYSFFAVSQTLGIELGGLPIQSGIRTPEVLASRLYIRPRNGPVF